MNTPYYSTYIYSMTTQNKFLNVLYINIQVMHTIYWEYTKVKSNIFLFVLVSLFLVGKYLITFLNPNLWCYICTYEVIIILSVMHQTKVKMRGIFMIVMLILMCRKKEKLLHSNYELCEIFHQIFDLPFLDMAWY